MKYMFYWGKYVFLVIIGVILFYLFLLNTNASILATNENLNKFYELTKNDPLFFDSEMDVDFLRESVNKMKREDDLFLSVDKLYRKKEPPEFQYPPEWRVWPDEFLAILPDIHDTTITFMDNPTPQKAKHLLGLYKNATLLYKKSAHLNLQVINSILENKPQLINQKILYLGSGTTPEIIRNDFILIQKNALELEDEIEHRRLCLYKGICMTGEKKQLPAQKSVKIAFHPLPNSILKINNSTIIEGPFGATTSCFGNVDEKPLNLPFYLKLNSLENSTHVRLEATLTNEKYYRDYTKIPDQSLAQIQLNNGIKYRPHRETTDYLCSDMGYLADLFMNHFKYSNNPKNKLKTLPYLIENTLSVAGFMVDQTIYAKKSFDPLYLLINRGAYSLYFGTFTPTIWRLDERPEFLLKGNFNFRSGYATYEDLKKQGFSNADIVKIYDVPSIFEVYEEELRTESE